MRDDGLAIPAYLRGDDPPDSDANPSGKPYEDRPDAFGLRFDDWMSLTGGSIEFYSRTARLWWALAGVEDDDGPLVKNDGALRNLLVSMGGDVRALVTLTRSSRHDEVRTLAATLENLFRRLELATEIANTLVRAENDRACHGVDPPHQATPKLIEKRKKKG